VANVPLTITTPAPDLVSMQDLPSEVSVQVQTTRDRVDALDTKSIRAEAVLAELPAGVHRVGVMVTLADERAQVVSITPQSVDVILEALTTRTLTPTVTTSAVDALPPGYALQDVSLAPETVSIQGALSRLDQVASARVSLALNSHRTGFQQALPVELLSGVGEPLGTLQPTPDTVLATVSITRTFETREAAIQARPESNSLEKGYQVTAIRLSPSEVTLTGQEAALDQAGDFVATAPINLAGVFTSQVSDVPLILPEGILALGYQGNSVTTVVARVTVAPANRLPVPGQGAHSERHAPVPVGTPIAPIGHSAACRPGAASGPGGERAESGRGIFELGGL
jgi:YbbR domain-containing protein